MTDSDEDNSRDRRCTPERAGVDRPLVGLQPGDRVWVEPWQSHGTLITLARRGARARVEVDHMRVELPVAELHAPRAEDDQTAAAPVAVGRPAARAVGWELDLHGKRVDEAIVELQRFLDRAMLAGLKQVRVVHGFGTGALCRAIHEYLRAATFIDGFRRGRDGYDDGGGGMTWVFLS